MSFSLHDPMIRRTVLDIFYSRRLFFLLQSSKVGFVQISLQIFRSNNDVKGRGYAPTEFFSVKLVSANIFPKKTVGGGRSLLLIEYFCDWRPPKNLANIKRTYSNAYKMCIRAN